MRHALATVLFFGAFALAHADEPPVPPEMPEMPVEADAVGRAILVRDPGGHAAVPRYLKFTPDSKKLISTGDDRTVQVWDVVSKERLRVIRPPRGVDGQASVALMGLNTLAVDRKSERVALCVAAKSEKAKERVRWSHSDGYFEKTEGDNWNEKTETKVFPFVETRRTDEFIELFDKSRTYTITLYEADSTIKKGSAAPAPLYRGTWDKIVCSTFVCSLETGQAQVLKHFGPHEFTLNGTCLAIAEGKNVNLVAIATDKVIETASLKNNALNLAFSPDGKTLAVVAGDAKVYLFDAVTLKPKNPLTVPDGGNNLRSVSWADDNTIVCRSFSGEKTLVVLDAVKGGLKHSYSNKDLLSRLPEGTKESENILEINALAGTTKVLVRVKYNSPSGSRPNANYLLDWASGEAGNVFIQVSRFGCEATAIAPDLSMAAQGDGNLNDIILWDPKEGKAFPDGKDVRRLRAKSRGARGEEYIIRWRPDGQGFLWEQLQERSGEARSFREMDWTALTVSAVSGNFTGKYGKANADLVVGHGVAAEYAKAHHTAERGIRWQSGPLTLKDIPLKGLWSICHWDFTFVPDSRVAYHPWGSNLTEVYDAMGKRLYSSRPVQSYIISWAVSPVPERPYLLIGSADQTLTVYNTATGKVLLTVYPTRSDWIAWTPEGYYAASAGGERLMGWHVDNGPDQLASFYPAERFRKQLYRPDVIKLVLEKGSVEEALKVANAALKKEGVKVQEGVVDLEKLLPPTVELSVVDLEKLPTVKFKVSAKAGAKEQPIKSLRLFVDGRPYSDAKAAATFERGVQSDVREWTVELPPGKHQVAVLARSADVSGISNEIELDCRAAAAKPVMHVLAIGVDEYKDKNLNLACAANDAQKIADTFRETCQGALYAQVRTHVLLNDKATCKSIRDKIQALRTDPKMKVKDNDLVVIFFAGHGAKEKEQFYLLTHEANVDDLANTALSGMQLRDDLKAMPCQVLLMLDACHSGAFGAKGKLAAKNLKPATDEATRTFTDDEVGIAVMCAAMGNETAAERKKNGLFTAAVVEALEAQADVPYNRANHRQYILHLQTYVFDKVSEESQDKQHPFLHLPWVVQSFPLRQLPQKTTGGSK